MICKQSINGDYGSLKILTRGDRRRSWCGGDGQRTEGRRRLEFWYNSIQESDEENI